MPSVSAIAGILVAVALWPALSHSQTRPLPAAAVDHHLHIQGPELTALLGKIAKRTPELFKGIDPALFNQRSGADALRVLDEAGIQQGVLLSVAYVFASPFAKQDVVDVARLTRLENEYNVAAALQSGGRLKAFVGVNPLSGGAIDELRYWAHRDGVTGVKVQLGNCGFDPKSDSDVAQLAAFFAAAKVAGLPIVIHARSASSHTRDDVQRFIDDVLSHAGELPVQIAHAGGRGGLDDETLAGLGIYAEAIKRGMPGTQHLMFDLSVVIVAEQTDPQLAQRLVELMRSIGVARFLMASDWPSRETPQKHNALLQSRLSLTDAEWRTLLGNRALYLDDRSSARE